MKQRKIKFRVWDIENKKMLDEKEGSNFEIEVNAKGECLFVRVGGSKVCELEVMQFTGLTDKNGKEIYEGDIIKLGCHTHIDYPDGFIGEIIWEKESACFILFIPNTQARVAHNMAAGIHDCISNDNNEIIGNIYENPKFLKNNKIN